ncbi:flagellar hook-basal body complex protein FliE [Halobacillus yeomjeoni]|uniref:Flagellar hook-basal body complex protein FliE n=1 Tax=Halobacillus yeomjeoni TaxID=311194 RepID=A0A931HTS4_9BACI|nr:flagellar hook-basal body complex protein FliE [Halobacillus yeomjeoni]MBH0229268.1 flagellar hook-basal body complex protein FliE [Halobacillus yeomjeoni]MCA0983333.1 flagellar hook-basal body complex protein FliE [Halobacillus yeomjeoni]
MKGIYSPADQPAIFKNSLSPQGNRSLSPSEVHANFAGQLKQAIDGVNKAQVESDSKTQALARGEIDDLHDVMIASQKASITMQTTVEVQSKVIEAYKEIMRMQV